MNILAIIPARKNSKRIENKNMVKLAGKPLIDYSVETAIEAKVFDEIIVSSDSDDILKHCKKFKIAGLKRPDELALDESNDFEYIKHAINTLGDVFEYIVILRPTSPLRTINTIKEIIEKMKCSDLDSIRSVSKITGKAHPHWTFRVDGEVLKPFVEGVDMNKYYQSQLLPDCYGINGVVDIIKSNNLKDPKELYGSKVGWLEVPRFEAIDIDNKEDLAYCEFLLSRGKES